MVLTKIWLIPIFYGICAISATATKYIFVSLLKKYPHILPFFSHRDASLFGECVFAHLVTYSSFLLMLIIYIRHRQTVEYYAHRLEWESSTWRIISTIIAFFGFCAAFSITIIANCEIYEKNGREDRSALKLSLQDQELAIIHDWADTIAFSFGLIYAWGQSILTWALIPRMCTLRVCILRFLIVFLETVTYIFYRYIKENPEFSKSYYLEACLWTISVCFHVYIITFFVELRFSYLHSPKVLFVRSDDQQLLVEDYN